MDFSLLLDNGIMLGVVIAFAGFFYSYFRFPGFRKGVKGCVRFLPAIAAFLAARTKDTPGKFDPHDALALMGRVGVWMHQVIADPENAKFEDVQDDLMAFVSRELDTYRAAGVEGVPDVTDESIQVYVEVVFEAVRRVMCEDSAGDNS